MLMRKYVLVTWVLLMLGGCGEVHKEMHAVRDDSYFKDAKVKYQLDGRKYQVPMGYQWYAHIKHQSWPDPKDTYTETTAFEVFALLPNLIPYSNAVADQFDNVRGRGDRLDIRLSSLSNTQKPLAELIEVWKQVGSFVEQPANSLVPELKRYLKKPGHHSSEDLWEDVYIIESAGRRWEWIECDMNVPFPSCHLYQRSNDRRPHLEYVFGMKYLPQWREVCDRGTALIESFVQSE